MYTTKDILNEIYEDEWGDVMSDWFEEYKDKKWYLEEEIKNFINEIRKLIPTILLDNFNDLEKELFGDD